MFFFTERAPFTKPFYQCVSDTDELKMSIYTTIVVIVQFVIPLILMVLAYALILFKITTSIGQGEKLCFSVIKEKVKISQIKTKI